MAAQVVVSRLVVGADWWFTTPTVVLPPATGLWLAHLAGFPLTTPWIAVALGLFVLAGLCWLPVAWLHYRSIRRAPRAHW